MMIIKITIALVIATFLLVPCLSANSVFSFYGFPNQESNMDIYGTGMGETGIGDVFRKNTGYLNPSLSTTLNQVYFSTGIMYGYFNYLDDQNNDFREDGLHFPYFNMTVPLRRHRMGFYFAPILSGNADVYSFDNVMDIDGTEYKYTEINRVRSYLYKGSLFYAYKHRIIDVGFSLDYYLGHRFRAWSQQETGTSGVSSVDPKYEYNQTFREPGITVGVNRRFGDFAIGATYRKNVIMKGSKELVSQHSVFDLGESRFELPHKIGVGSVYRLTDNHRVTADIEYEMWGNTDFYDEVSDTYKIGVGFAYEPYWGHDKWYQKIPLRTGGYFRKLPFEAKGEELSEIALTLGFTIPLHSPNAQLDFAFKYLMRGDTDKNGYQDRNILFGIGLSGFDFFRARPRRIEHRDIPEAEFEGFR